MTCGPKYLNTSKENLIFGKESNYSTIRNGAARYMRSVIYRIFVR